MRSRVLLYLLATSVVFGCLPRFKAEAITIQLDYSYDTGNYFTGAAQDRLEDAAGFFEDLLEDDLDAITPTSGTYPIPDSWIADFKHPSTGASQNETFLSVPADTIIIFVGARDHDPGVLAEAGFGGITYSGGGSFVSAVTTRGETGVGTTDFAPWGGSLSVDNLITWDTTLAGGTDQHLYSTLLHEIGHVLGIGTAPSWDAQVTSGEFTGTEAVAEHGGNVPLTGNDDHWQDGTMSEIYGTMTSQETSMDPIIIAGTEKLFTALDVAALEDIGWEIAPPPIPEPSQSLLAGSGLLLLLRRRRA
jgi:hypothetical protein